MRRGDVRSALLIALLDGPGHGYQLMQTLGARTGGAWQPSPGAVYPSLEALLDEGLVTANEDEGRRVFTLTDAGRRMAEERRTQGPPWAVDGAEPDSRDQLRQAAHEVLGAAKQVGMAGSPAQVERAAAILTQARKDLYLLLAEE
ncbi:MAG: PadR family transcriptional regulator [Acidimicrobiales bacterium]